MATRWDSKYDLHLLCQCGSTHYYLSRSFLEIHITCCWDTKQAITKHCNKILEVSAVCWWWWIRQQVWSTSSISVWQYILFFKQIFSWDTHCVLLGHYAGNQKTLQKDPWSVCSVLFLMDKIASMICIFYVSVAVAELNLECGMCTIPQESVLSRNYRVLVRAGSRANAEMHAFFSSHHGSFRRLLKVKVQSRPEKERINKLLSFLVL